MSDIIRTGGVLLPDEKIDLYKWAVIACDQFTADPSYWQTLAHLVGDAPSTLKLVYPECFLSDIDEARISSVNAEMHRYLDDGLFRETAAVRTVRSTVYGRRRTGFVFKIDLDAYSFDADSRAPVRATEGTIAERIPPRVRIRRGAPLELPHIMLLYEDRDFIVEKAATAGDRLYDSDLNMRGGHIAGYAVADPDALLSAFDRLSAAGSGPLFLVGDGNHSLAAAKACLDERRAAGLPACRYALVEAVNLYDEGIVFEPIHRLVRTKMPGEFVAFLRERVRGDRVTPVYLADGTEAYIPIPEDGVAAVAAVQDALDAYVRETGASVDYIHGTAALRRAAAAGAGIVLPAMEKSALFPYVTAHGILPRKTFSMGEAEEKRYYLEAAAL